MRIGDLARAAGTTVRTIRYYEEIGLLEPAADREVGAHRAYDEADLERLAVVLRLRDLLGVSLEDLKELVAAEKARELRRAEFRDESTSPQRRAAILGDGLALVERQLALLAARRDRLDELEAELLERRASISARQRELDGVVEPA